MGEWIYRNGADQDWISLIFFANLLFVIGMINLDPARVKRLLKFYASDIYMSKHSNEKNLNFLSPFNLLSLLVLLNTLCLFLLSLSKFELPIIEFAFEYYYLFFVCLLFIGIRYVLVWFTMKQMGLERTLKPWLFKSFTHHTQFAVFLFLFLLLSYYTTISKPFFLGVFVVVVGLWFLYQSRNLFTLFRSRPQDVLYIILYLCTLKLIPWYWFYIFAIEPRL